MMSHCVFRWQAKVAALGLLMCLILLSGATCMDELVPGLGQNAGTTTPPPGTTGQNTPPTINVSSPTASMTITPGTVVQISWRISDPSHQAQIKVFYDTDANAANGFTTLNVINNSNQGVPTFYNWSTTGMAAGTYYVGAQINDGTNPAVTSYAVGQVVISTSSAAKELNLGDLGNSVKGCIFEGMSFVGHLGEVMTGRFDVLSTAGTPDSVSDFLLVAPTADSHYAEDPEVGEAYAILGWNSQITTRSSAWYNGGRFNVNQVGSDPDVPGFIAVGPAYISKSLGITSVQAQADLDGDGGSELMFGTPLLVNGRYETQDYDPESIPLGAYYLEAPFAYPPGHFDPPPTPPDWHDWYGGRVWSSGYVTVLASTTPRLYRAATPQAPGLGGVIHIDEIGQALSDPFRREFHPRSIRYLQSGLRVYPYAQQVNYRDFLQNDYRFGQQLGTEDIDGDGVADWLISAPQNANDAGQIDIGFSSLALLWTQGLPATANCYSWPYMEGPPGRRIPTWPFGLIDKIRGDELKAPHGHLGNPTGVGDFNNDKLGDIAASTPSWSKAGLLPNAGAAYLVFGRAPFGDHAVSEIKDPVVLNALPGIAVYGSAASDRVGETMAALGRPNYGMIGYPRLKDFNADGLPDWAIAAPGRTRQIKDADGNITELPRANAGAIAIIWGNSRLDGQFTWDQIGTPDLPGIIITGTFQGDAFGTYISQCGDVNGDGSDDLLVAAPGVENPLTGAQDTGVAYVIYGPPAAGTGVAAYQQLSGTYDINDLMQDGPVKVRAYYGAAAGHKIGPVAGAGDIDNDGYEDILIADPLASPLGRTEAGNVYLIFGGQY